MARLRVISRDTCIWETPTSAAICIMQRAHAGDQTLPMWLDFWTAVYQAIDD